jgi:hypothetical protein
VPKNVVLLVFESFSAWALNEEDLPFTLGVGHDGFISRKHHAGANCTSAALFTLLYGANSAWAPVSAGQQKGSYPIAWLRSQGYRTGFYSSIPAGWMKIDKHLLVPTFDEVDTIDDPLPVSDRDQLMLKRFFEKTRTVRTPLRFSVLFFNSTHHNYYYPPEFGKHLPAAPDYIDGDRHAYHDAIVNRYRNSLAYADSLVQQVFAELKRDDELGRTIVVITGDHGEAFYEHQRYLHGTDFTFSQVGTPLVIYGIPGLRGEALLPTGHEQILPTIIAALAPRAVFPGTGSGRPIGAPDAFPLMTSGWTSYNTVPTHWLAVYPDYKLEFSVTGGVIRESVYRSLTDEPLNLPPDELLPEPLLARLEVPAAEPAPISYLKNRIRTAAPRCEPLRPADPLVVCFDKVAWDEAIRRCRELQMEPASAVTPTEMKLADAMLEEHDLGDTYWAAARFDPARAEVVWQDGSSLSGPWEADQDPFGAPFAGPRPPRGDCVRSSSLYPGYWQREDCGLGAPFLCRGAPGQLLVQQTAGSAAEASAESDECQTRAATIAAVCCTPLQPFACPLCRNFISQPPWCLPGWSASS